MRRALVAEVADAVALVDLFLTVHPGYPVVAAIDEICDLEGIVDDRDRRVVRHGVEARRALVYGTEAKRAAA